MSNAWYYIAVAFVGGLLFDSIYKVYVDNLWPTQQWGIKGAASLMYNGTVLAGLGLLCYYFFEPDVFVILSGKGIWLAVGLAQLCRLSSSLVLVLFYPLRRYLGLRRPAMKHDTYLFVGVLCTLIFINLATATLAIVVIVRTLASGFQGDLVDASDVIGLILGVIWIILVIIGVTRIPTELKQL